MEELGQDYGFVLYEHEVTQAMSGLLQPGDRPRDRVIIYVNEARIGVIDSICMCRLASFNTQYQHPKSPLVSNRKKEKGRMGRRGRAARRVANRDKRPVPDEHHLKR